MLRPVLANERGPPIIICTDDLPFTVNTPVKTVKTYQKGLESAKKGDFGALDLRLCC